MDMIKLIQDALNVAIKAAVAEAVAPLVERIAALENSEKTVEAPEIDYAILAEKIDTSDVAADIDVDDIVSRVADELSYDVIAERLDVGEVAQAIDLDDLAESILNKGITIKLQR